MSVEEKTIIEVLQEFGLSGNAAKAYTALLKQNPSTGYEISIQAGIPRSAIYSVLNQLKTKGLVNSIGESPTRYFPIAPASLIEHLDHIHTERITILEDALSNLSVSEEAFDFWHLHGYHNIVLKMKELIKNAQEKIFLSAWEKEVVALGKELKAAEMRGVQITLFSFCKLQQEYGVTVTYNLLEKELLQVWNPRVILVIDHTESIMGSTRERSDSRAIWTRNKAITEIATDHIILDITLAGQRLNFDPNPIVKRVMRRPDLPLKTLINSHKSP
ncbi:MAG: TrmB family transcriptional regulator [Fidelibacterota bacterium]